MSSRVARKPISLPKGVEVQVKDLKVTVKGPKGEIQHQLHPNIGLSVEDNQILILKQSGVTDAIAGTTRAILNNHVTGVTAGFTKKLQLVGVGYRAQVTKANDGRSILNLTFGLSHPVSFIVP